MKIINFTHLYYKLQNRVFTTIRGKSRFNEFVIGDEIGITVNRTPFCVAVLVDKELAKLSALSTEFLRKDCEYASFKMQTRADFINLINSFRRFHKIENEEAELSVFYLSKIEEKQHEN